MTDMKAGVIVNASAGRFEKLKQKIKILEKAFDSVLTGPGKLGGDFLESAETVEVSSGSLKGAVRELVAKLIGKVDVIVSVGGDGTANMVAEAIIDEGADVPIMGVAGGTANVGPLIRFSFEDLEALPPFEVEEVDCLKVWKGEAIIGYAFVDVVFGDTFLGTLRGKMVNMDALEFLKSGKKVPKRPSEDICARLGVFKNGKEIGISVRKVAQVAVSPLNFSLFYAGKAVTGALSWAPFFGSVGALAVSSRVIVDSGLTEEALEEPVVVEHVLFSEGEKIRVEGFKRGICIVIDGNPVCECDEPVTITGIRKAVKVVANRKRGCMPVGGVEFPLKQEGQESEDCEGETV